MTGLLARVDQIFAKEGIVPVLTIGFRSHDGVFRMALDPHLKSTLDDEFIDDLTAAIRHGLKEMLDKPLDDMELR